MKKKYLNQNNPSVAVIQGRNAGTSGIGDILLIYLMMTLLFFVMIHIRLFEGILAYVMLLIIIFIYFIYALPYVLYPKTLLLYENELIGPFFRYNDLIRHPFKVNFQFKYENIEKMELYYNENSYWFSVKFFMKNGKFSVGLKHGEQVRLQEIMKELRPEITIKIYYETFALLL